MPDHNEPHLGEFLTNLRKQGDGFQTPSPTLLEEMANRVLAEGRSPAKVRPMYRTWWSAAAAVILLLAATFLLLPKGDDLAVTAHEATPNISSEALLAELDAEDIDAYISDQLDDFETELFANAPVND